VSSRTRLSIFPLAIVDGIAPNFASISPFSLKRLTATSLPQEIK
jgi:hypothetical protein